MKSIKYVLTERKLQWLLTTWFLLHHNRHFNHIRILMISIWILYIATFLKACCISTLEISKKATVNFHLTHLMTSKKGKKLLHKCAAGKTVSLEKLFNFISVQKPYVLTLLWPSVIVKDPFYFHQMISSIHISSSEKVPPNAMVLKTFLQII
jgi:hypothetical protein